MHPHSGLSCRSAQSVTARSQIRRGTPATRKALRGASTPYGHEPCPDARSCERRATWASRVQGVDSCVGERCPGVRRCNLTLPADDPSDCSLAATSLRSHQPQRCSRAGEPALRGWRRQAEAERYRTARIGHRVAKRSAIEEVGASGIRRRPMHGVFEDARDRTCPCGRRGARGAARIRWCGCHPRRGDLRHPLASARRCPDDPSNRGGVGPERRGPGDVSLD
jgi:hypothetical protein